MFTNKLPAVIIEINVADVAIQSLARGARETAEQIERPFVPLTPGGLGIIPNPIGMATTLFGKGVEATKNVVGFAKPIVEGTVGKAFDATIGKAFSTVGTGIRKTIGAENVDTMAKNFAVNSSVLYENLKKDPKFKDIELPLQIARLS